ncbi:MAG: ABC transporter substrate-binding protein, partial [Hespellia sp.]|nr:ABC transporter substrate-binding protein [Hespellia sp.]
MKKRLVALLVAVMTVTTLAAGCGSPSKKADSGSDTNTAAAADNAEKAKGDTFTSGFDAEYPTYGYMDDNGEYVGFDLD